MIPGAFIYRTFSEITNDMAIVNKLGIWMDHSNAHLIEFTEEPMQTEVLGAGSAGDKEHHNGKSEKVTHNSEQHHITEYYKKLGESIRNFGEVILFGPTDAKTELLNTLRADHRFDKIKIEVQQAGKLTDNQQHAFVREYFSHH